MENTRQNNQPDGLKRAVEMASSRIAMLMERKSALEGLAKDDYEDFFERQSEEMYEVCHELRQLNDLLRGPLKRADTIETAMTLARICESMGKELTEGDVERCVNLPMMRRSFLLRRRVTQRLLKFYTALVRTILKYTERPTK